VLTAPASAKHSGPQKTDDKQDQASSSAMRANRSPMDHGRRFPVRRWVPMGRRNTGP
jgi:hypothetical protein